MGLTKVFRASFHPHMHTRTHTLTHGGQCRSQSYLDLGRDMRGSWRRMAATHNRLDRPSLGVTDQFFFDICLRTAIGSSPLCCSLARMVRIAQRGILLCLARRRNPTLVNPWARSAPKHLQRARLCRLACRMGCYCPARQSVWTTVRRAACVPVSARFSRAHVRIRVIWPVA